MFLTGQRSIANFDSTTAMLRALSRFLNGRDFPGLGFVPAAMEPLGRVLNRMPQFFSETFYIWSGWSEAVPARKLSQFRAEQISKWMVGQYPERPYSSVAIGSSGGAGIHLCAALGMPWLPQTYLIPVRRPKIHPDEPKQDMEWGREPAKWLLQNNPDLQLHHMNDANQDRLMIQRMTYFRVKRRTLGPAYEEFLRRNLQPGGTIVLIESDLKWPTVRLGDRYVFQHGAVGGATPDEFLHGSWRIEQYLERYRSHRRRWDSPEPDGESPEAEWGFEPALREDVERFARRHGYQIRRIIYGDPESLSPMVADLYRWWYRRRNLIANRLLAESFLVMEPWWMLHTASIPFWMTFNKEPSAEMLENYLDEHGPIDEVYIMLFSHGVDSVGLVSIDRWRSILRKARKRSGFVGVDERAYPRDFAVFRHYHTDLPKVISARYPLPGSLTLSEFEQFLGEQGDRYPLQWIAPQPAREGVPEYA